MNADMIKQESTSIRDIEWNARQQKAIALSFLATGLGIALILGFGTFLGN